MLRTILIGDMFAVSKMAWFLGMTIDSLGEPLPPLHRAMTAPTLSASFDFSGSSITSVLSDSVVFCRAGAGSNVNCLRRLNLYQYYPSCCSQWAP